MLDGIVQELDIETGEVLFEWHSLDHVGLEETLRAPTDLPGFDYFHLNSIDLITTNLLISARGPRRLQDRPQDGRDHLAPWRREERLRDGSGARFFFQHDARRQHDGTITIFDNGGVTKRVEQSRGIVLHLDEEV